MSRQLTGTMRNVAGDGLFVEDFVINSGGIHVLCKLLKLFSTDMDIISNVARILR